MHDMNHAESKFGSADVHGREPSTGSFKRPGHCPLTALEGAFVDNWAGLARAFGMDATLGRVHALTFVRDEALHATAVGETLGLEPIHAARYLEELVRWGVVRKVTLNGATGFEADGDPWSWFMVTLKERGRREFGPLLDSIREANGRAQALRTSLPPDDRRRIERIARFTQFVEQIASVIETFASVGAGPVMSALRMVARVRGPRLVRA
jgi:DNA-binding transcriptional regulator GbsR (MarR family)